MKIEEGESYRDTDGEMHGPMKRYRDNVYPEFVWSDGVHTFTDDGRHPKISLIGFCGPVEVKTVVHHQIIDGTYGIVDVRQPHAEGREGMIGIKISASDRYVHVNAEQLSEAIDVLIQIRDALKANAK